VNDIIPGSTVGPSMIGTGTGTMQSPSLVHVGRLLLPSVAKEDEGDDVVKPSLFIFLDDLSLFDFPLLPPSSSLSREEDDTDIIASVVVDSSSFAICAACVLLLGLAPLAAVGPGVVFGRCSRRSECSSAAARVPVSVANVEAIDEFATATIVAASGKPFILSVRSCIPPSTNHESITKKSFQKSLNGEI